MSPGVIVKTKCLIVSLMFALTNCSLSKAQTVYTHDPTSYPTSACSSGNLSGTPCGLFFYGSILRLKGTTGTQLRLTMAKCDNSAFSTYSYYYIKWSTSSDPATIACSNTYIQISPDITPYTYTSSNPGFTSGTRYYMLVVLGEDGARRYSNKVSVTASTPPTAATSNATLVTSNSARLNGSVNPNGSSTAYAFEYGTTTSYGSNTTITNIGSGTTTQNVNDDIGGLAPSTTYHFRILAANSAGTVYGFDKTFTTNSAGYPPTVSTGNATSVTSTGATLNGNVNPNGSNTACLFEYGATAAYGNITTATNIGSGTTTLPFNEAVTGLQPNSTYHYRIHAGNSFGFSYGGDITFSTSAPTITYSYSPPLNVYTVCGTGMTSLNSLDYINCSSIAGTTNFINDNVKVALISHNTTSGAMTFRIQKCAGFFVNGTNGKLFIREGPDVWCSSYSITNSTTTYKDITIDYFTGFSGLRQFEAFLITSTQITKLYAGIVSVTGSNPDFYVTITNPLTNSFWNTGNAYNIQWNDNINENVKITLSRGGLFLSTITNSTPSNGSYIWTLPASLSTGNDYEITVRSVDNSTISGSSGYFTINGQSTTNCSFMDCSSSSNCGSTTYQDETFEAVQYLCSHNIVSGVNGSVLPDQVITRAALAKITFFGLYGDSLAVPASLLSDYLPSPYNDLQNPSKYYFRSAKFLLYLQYGDSITPFDRNRANFFPNGTIKRIHALKVLFEAFNLPQDNSGPSPFNDMTTVSEGYGYAHWAFHHGITTETTFDPNGTCTRAHAFIFLYRILDLINQGIISAPVPTVADFFIPGIYTPLTLAAAKSLETGNFNHYTKSSFKIPGRNVSMDFDHSYNSYLTEMPADFMPIQPLSEGWSHSYNSYLLFIPAESTSDERWMVYWPDGSIHSYKYVNGAYRRETEGIYDTLIYVTSNEFKIVTKNKIAYTFTKSTSLQYEEVAYMLTSIKDRNDNTITITYMTSINLDDWIGGPKSSRKVYQVTDPANRTLTFFYTASPANLLTKVTDPLGRNIEFTYTNGHLSSFKDALNQTTEYNYYTYPQGPPLLKEIILPRSNKITNTYKNRKLLYSQANGNPGTRIALDQDNFTNPAATNYLQSTVTAPTGVVQKFDYNSKGKNTRIYGNAETDVTTQYNTPGQTWLPSVVTDNKTAVSASISYDSNGNTTHIQTTGGAFTVNESYEYNTFNDVTKYTDGRGHATIYEYNATGNLVKVTDPLNNSTIYTPNSTGQVTSVTTPSNVTTTYGYNGYGNLNLVSVPVLGISSSMTYDNASRLVSSTNFSGQTTSYLYDDNDNMTRETNALSFQTNSAYDANDNLSSITNAKGVSTSMNYDTYDRLTAISFAGTSKSYTYYDDGSVKTFTDPNGHVFTCTYDAAGRIVTDGYATFTYDATTGNLQTIAKDGKTITYGYDGLNRIATVSYDDFAGNTVTYTYDNNDNLASMKYPGNKTVTYTYDALNRLTHVNDWNGATTVYTYRPDGQLLTMTFPNSVKCSYSYDNAGRMTGVEYKRNSGSGSTLASYTFTLDNVGNHLQEQITEPYEAYPAIPNLTTNYTYNTANRIQTAGGMSFGYDNNGNTLSKTGYTYIYDVKNNLTGVSGNYTAAYEYDGLGNRRKKGNTRFVLDILGMSQVLVETDLSGNPQNYYVYGLGLISRINASGATSYYISDFRGSTVAMTDATTAANITHKYQYDDFGKITQITEADFNPFRYVGKYGVMYEDSLNYFMRARYYDPAIGRFMSEDPVWSVNLYPYSNNNPITNIDFKGTSYEVAALIGEMAGYLGTAYMSYNAGRKMENSANKFMKIGEKYALEGNNRQAMDAFSTSSMYAKEASNFYQESINDLISGSLSTIMGLFVGKATDNMGKNLINSINAKLTSMGMKQSGKVWYFAQNAASKNAVNMKSKYLILLKFIKGELLGKMIDSLKS